MEGWKQRHQAGVYCSGSGEKWSDPWSNLKVELPGFRDGWEDSYERRRGIRDDCETQAQSWLLGWGRPGKKQVCEGNPRVQSWFFKFEVPKVRLSGRLHANTWIQREEQPRDICHQYTNVIKATRLDRITWEILQRSFSKQYIVFTIYQHCVKSFTAMYSIFLITLR